MIEKSGNMSNCKHCLSHDVFVTPFVVLGYRSEQIECMDCHKKSIVRLQTIRGSVSEKECNWAVGEICTRQNALKQLTYLSQIWGLYDDE